MLLKSLNPEIVPNKYPITINTARIKKLMGLDFPKKLVSIGVILYFCFLKFKDMTWIGFWEAIASIFQNTLFIPLDALRTLELSTWWGANIVSWIFLLIGAAAFIYWMIHLNNFHESSECTYTYDETI